MKPFTVARLIRSAPPAPPAPGGPHSYWRVRFTAAQSGSYVSVAEVQFRATVGGVDQCSGGTAIASASFSGAYLPANAFDNASTTEWVSGLGMPQWIGYQFASPVEVSEVAIQATDAAYAGSTEQPRDFTVEYSDDGTTWAVLTSRTFEPGWTVEEVRLYTMQALTKSLLHFEGADASTTFTDVAGRTWTPVSSAQIDTAQFKYGSASGLFNGTSDYLSTPDSLDFAFGTGDFTIEAWVRPVSTGTNKIIYGQWSNTAAQRSVLFYVTNTVAAANVYDTASRSITGGSVSHAGVWTHVALVRFGNTCKIYVNGVGGSSSTVNGSLQNSTETPYIGAQQPNLAWWSGHLDEVRITKGVALYTANFTPPSAAFPDTL